MSKNPNLRPALVSEDDCYSHKQWVQLQYLANQFWKRWLDEFLPNLLHRQKWFGARENMKVDDVVLLVESQQQRSKWVLGRVIEAYPNKGGLARTVSVKTQHGTMKRPITKLCPVVVDNK